jgi:integrase
MLDSGALGIRIFDESATIWDYYRGQELPEDNRIPATDIAKLGRLAVALRQSKWRESSRALYNAYFAAWVSFALLNGCSVMPAEPRWIELWLTFMTLYYAASTVATAAAALVAMHLWNDHEHPFRTEIGLKQMLEAIQKVGICRQMAPKYIVDSNFIVSMCKLFLDEYPFFRKEWFDPWAKGSKSVIIMRSVGLVLLGVELGVRPSSLVALTACCWQPRADGSVGVQVDLAKNGKNGVLFVPVLERRAGSFSTNYTAISFFEEFIFTFMDAMGQQYDPGRCIKIRHRTAHCRCCPFLFSAWPSGNDNMVRQPGIRVGEVSDSVKQWAKRVGRDPVNYSAKSLRRASTSIAAARKVDKKIRRMHGGWKSKQMLNVYTEVSRPDQLAVSKAVHDTVMKSKRARGRKVRFEFRA